MKKLLLAACLALSAAACTVVDRTRDARLEPAAKWAILPIANHTETPQAGLRAEAIAESVLRSMGVSQLERYPSAMNPESLFDPAERKSQEQAVGWAKEQKVRFALSGSVEEWRYKVGVDGEAAVGLTLTIVDLESGAIVYSAAGGKSGWSREALSAVAQKLTRELLSGVQLGR